MRRPALVLILCASAVAAHAEDAAPPKQPPVDAAAEEARRFRRSVDAAVERGVAFLRSRQKPDGSFGTTEGETGIALLALRHCGVPADDKACRAAAKRLASDLPSGTVYGDSFGVLALLAQDAEAHRDVVVKAIDRIVRAQCANGQWSYLAKGRGDSKVGDNSNSQCAVLALGFAREQGFDVPAEPLRRFAAFAERTRNEDGGFGYSEHQDTASYGSMTAGVVSTWALASAGAERKRTQDAALGADARFAPSIRWLAARFEAAKNPRPSGPPTGWSYYWLWSLERAAAVLGAERIGDVDWYAAGARSLVERQRESGSWIAEREIADTCWALLFLRRSTHQLVTTPRRPGQPVTGK